MAQHGWIGFDFDGTLATYQSGQYPAIGEPIPRMVELVRRFIEDGFEVRTVTARAAVSEEVRKVHEWCHEHIGTALIVTDRKDFDMLCIFDDRAVAVERNTGRMLGGTLPHGAF